MTTQRTDVKLQTTQLPNVSKYVKSVSDGFLYALEACLIIWSCPKNFFSVRITLAVSKVLGGFFFSFETAGHSDGSGRKFEVKE